MKQQLHELVDLLEDFSTGMLATRTPYGHISTRPMQLQEPRADQALWFVSSSTASSVENIKNSSYVNLSFRRDTDQAWISVAATATLNHNRELIESLWKDSWNTWLTNEQGRDTVVLIELEPFQIDFWEPEKGSLGRIFELAKAQFTDSTPDLTPIRTLHISDALLAPAMEGPRS